MDCFLYSGERQTLFNLVEQYIPNFPQLNKSKKYEILVIGSNTDNPDYNFTNTKISIAVQNLSLLQKDFLTFPLKTSPSPFLSVKVAFNTYVLLL